MKHENETGIAKEGAAQVEAAEIIATIKTELDVLGRLWMDYGKQAGGFNPESGALYGQIQFTRTKVLDYVAMLSPPPPASPSEGEGEISDEQIDALNQQAQDQAISSGIPPHRALARAVLSLSPSRGEAVDALHELLERAIPKGDLLCLKHGIGTATPKGKAILAAMAVVQSQGGAHDR